MPSTNLKGPYTLTEINIDEIFSEIKSGTYVLGHLTKAETFVVEYVGRSDDNLNGRLHDWVGSYTHFKARYFKSAEEAFERECRIYHDFGEKEKLDNKIHPDRSSSDWKCPVCDIFD